MCGYDALDEPPYNSSGRGSLQICPSCGFQFGFHDEVKGMTFEEWRSRWISEGMPWFDEDPPHAWDPVKQLRAIDIESQNS